MTECIGIKSGLALTRVQYKDHLVTAYREAGVDETIQHWWESPDHATVSVRAEVLEGEFLAVLKQLGAITDERPPGIVIADWVKEHKYGGELPQERLMEVVQELTQLELQILVHDNVPPGMEEVAKEARRRFLMDRTLPDARRWDGVIALGDLFESEDIPPATIADQHFDQRFIDYLASKPDQLTNIHWRQFEYLCGEYFSRKGYDVEITPPRGDGGIDVFARRQDELLGPELVVVQAKRLGGDNTVKINEVKALWSDANDHNATRALIATTTQLEEGARSYCEARKYRYTTAEAEDVRRWLHQMSTLQA